MSSSLQKQPPLSPAVLDKLQQLEPSLTLLNAARSSLTFPVIFSSQSPTFQLIRKLKTSKNLLTIWVYAKMHEFLNLLSPETQSQNQATAEAFAEDIIQNRIDWKPEDVLQFLNFIQHSPPVNTKTLNIMQLSAFLKKYEEEKADERVKYYRGLRDKEVPDAEVNEEGRKILRKTIEELDKSLRAEREEERLKGLEKRMQARNSPENMILNGYLKEWDALQEKQGEITTFIKFKGKMVTCQDYISLRFAQDFPEQNKKS